jgi:hypothetical protein
MRFIGGSKDRGIIPLCQRTLSISLSACKFVAEKVPVGRPPEKGHLEFPFLFWNALYFLS